MPAKKKYGLTDPTGGKQSEKQVKQTDRKARERLKKRFEKPLETVTVVAHNVAESINTVRDAVNTVGSAINGSSPQTNQDVQTGYKQAQGIASQYGIVEQDVKSLLGSDPYKADGSSPEQTLGEAKKQQLKLQRQYNAQETRAAKLKLGRKIVQNQREETRLVGDVVDWNTAQIETGTKVVTNQISATKYNIEQSRLLETEELLVQQTDKTSATQRMTQVLKDQHEERYNIALAELEGLKVDAQNAKANIENKRLEMEAFLLEG